MKNFKFLTHGKPVLSVALQAIVFELGGEWCKGFDKHKITNVTWELLTLEDGILRHHNYKPAFDEIDVPEIDLATISLAKLEALLKPEPEPEPELFFNVYRSPKNKTGYALNSPFEGIENIDPATNHPDFLYTAKLVPVEKDDE